MWKGGWAAVTAAMLVSPAPAATQDVSGAWRARFAQSVRTNRDGSVEILRWGEARLVLRVEGERVEGEWLTNVREPIRWRVAGTLREGRLRLAATENDADDPELDVIEGLNWEGTATGQTIEGDMWIDFRGRRREPTRTPWNAVRPGGGP